VLAAKAIKMISFACYPVGIRSMCGVAHGPLDSGCGDNVKRFCY
jgi:hypothetical protein